MTHAVRPGGHAFIPGDGFLQGKDGRRYALCSQCAATKRAAAHQPLDPRSRKVLAPVPAPAPVRTLPVREEPREVRMLRLAIDAALDLNGQLGYTARQRLVAARAALDLPVDAPPKPVAPVGAPASRTTRPSHRADSRWVRRSVRGVFWPIAEAALDQGYEARRTGNGHVRFQRGIQSFSLTTTDTSGTAHGLQNALAAARRAGVKC